VKRRIWITAAAVLTWTAVAPAFAKPNFTGKWVINKEKSNFGRFPAPEKMERTVTFEDPDLTYTTVQTGRGGEVTSTLKYKTDGSESTNNLRGMEVKGVAQWIGDVLQITSKRSVQDGEVKQVEKWSISEDGKTLTIGNQVTMPDNSAMQLKYVFEKQ
jgi:hypothetical protein